MEFLPVWFDGERVYAGFWKRFKAAIIDTLVILLLVLPLWRLRHSDDKTLVAIDIILFSLLFMYDVFFNARFGGTPGKLLVGVRIAKPDGSPIGWLEAWKRSSVNILFTLLVLYIQLVPLSQVNDQQFASLAYPERMSLLESYSPSWLTSVNIASNIWFWSELIILLLNERKRALHDFIARTVVIHKKFATKVNDAKS